MKRALAIATLVAATSGLTTTVQAADSARPAYSSIQGFYVNQDDDAGYDGDGFMARGELQFGARYFFSAELMTTTDSDIANNADVRHYQLGFGRFFEINNAFTFDAQAFIGKTDTDLDQNSVHLKGDDEFLGAQLGLRKRFGNQFEAGLGYRYTDYRDVDAEKGFLLDAFYYFTNRLAAGVHYRSFDNTDSLALGLRYDF